MAGLRVERQPALEDGKGMAPKKEKGRIRESMSIRKLRGAHWSRQWRRG